MSKDLLTVGLLSDTHGRLHPGVMELLRDVDHIIHAGDVGSPEILAALRSVAPVTAVRGNCDLESWAADLPWRASVVIGGAHILVEHILRRQRGGAGDCGAGDGRSMDVVVFGHTHTAFSEEREGTLYVNPGAAGPRRFGRPRTVARLGIVSLEPVEAEAGPRARPRLKVTVLSADG